MSSSFHALKVAGVRREIDDAVSLLLDVPAGLRDTFRFAPGQHLTLRAAINGEEVRRKDHELSTAGILHIRPRG